jgi:hypothetical protein
VPTRTGRELECRRATQAAKSATVMASHQAFKTHTDAPVKHLLWCTHRPHPLPRLSPGRVPRDYIITHPDTPRSTEQPNEHSNTVTWQPLMGKHPSDGTKAAAGVTAGLSVFPRPG